MRQIANGTHIKTDKNPLAHGVLGSYRQCSNSNAAAIAALRAIVHLRKLKTELENLRLASGRTRVREPDYHPKVKAAAG